MRERRALGDGDAHHLLAGVGGRLGDRHLHLLRLGATDADPTLAVADHDGGAEAHVGPALGHLGDALHLHHRLLEAVALLLPAAPATATATAPATATATATVPDASRASLSFPSCSGLPHFPVRRWHGKSDVGEEKHIITAYGPDRPGLVSSLAKAVFDAKGNVENTRMARLGNDCNVMMLVSFANATPEDHRAFAQAADEIPGLTVKVRPTRAIRRSDADAVDTSRWRRVFLHGTDFPGLAYQMTSFLASNGINIEMMNTDTQPSPFGDDELFTIDAVIEIQPDVSLRAFKRSMDRLKKKLGVDIVISDHESHRDD